MLYLQAASPNKGTEVQNKLSEGENSMKYNSQTWMIYSAYCSFLLRLLDLFLRNYTELVLPFVFATCLFQKPFRRRGIEEPLLMRNTDVDIRAFFKTWTIIPSESSYRVYVHPWPDTVSFRFLPCSRYPNSRKCGHTPRRILIL